MPTTKATRITDTSMSNMLTIRFLGSTNMTMWSNTSQKGSKVFRETRSNWSHPVPMEWTYLEELTSRWTPLKAGSFWMSQLYLLDSKHVLMKPITHQIQRNWTGRESMLTLVRTSTHLYPAQEGSLVRRPLDCIRRSRKPSLYQ